MVFLGKLLRDFLYCQKQRVILNGQHSSWDIVNATVPQGSILQKQVFCKKGLRPQACNFIKKETLVQVFSCEFCEISKNTFFHRAPRLLQILSSLLFLIHINDLSNGLPSDCKFFDDDISLFSVVNDIQTRATTLSNDQGSYI